MFCLTKFVDTVLICSHSTFSTSKPSPATKRSDASFVSLGGMDEENEDEEVGLWWFVCDLCLWFVNSNTIVFIYISLSRMLEDDISVLSSTKQIVNIRTEETCSRTRWNTT